MIELLVEVCLASQADACVERWLPAAACEADAAERWTRNRPELELRGWRCGPPPAPLEVVEIADGVFVHRGKVALIDPQNAGDHANVGFVIGSESVAVIDAGGSRQVGEALLAAVRTRTDQPVRWLILTHMHPDHVFGASVFSEAGAAVIGHERLGPALAARAETYRASLLREAGPTAAIGSDIVLPDEFVTGRREIDLGDRTLVLEAHPTSHTDNDLTALDKMTGTWFLSDLVFDRHLPVVDGSALGWVALLDDLTARPAERVVPGHGAISLPWPEGGEATRGYLIALIDQTRVALARGESMMEASERIGLDLRGDWELFDDFNTRNATAAYRELEWE